MKPGFFYYLRLQFMYGFGDPILNRGVIPAKFAESIKYLSLKFSKEKEILDLLDEFQKLINRNPWGEAELEYLSRASEELMNSYQLQNDDDSYEFAKVKKAYSSKLDFEKYRFLIYLNQISWKFNYRHLIELYLKFGELTYNNIKKCRIIAQKTDLSKEQRIRIIDRKREIKIRELEEYELFRITNYFVPEIFNQYKLLEDQNLEEIYRFLY